MPYERKSGRKFINSLTKHVVLGTTGFIVKGPLIYYFLLKQYIVTEERKP